MILQQHARILEHVAREHRHDPLAGAIVPCAHQASARPPRSPRSPARSRRRSRRPRPSPPGSPRRSRASTTPSVSRMARTARSHDAGSPIRIAVATVSACTAYGASRSPPRSRARTAPRPPPAPRRGAAAGEMSPQRVRLAQRLPERGGVAEVAGRQHDPVGRLPAELLQQLEHDRLLPLEPERVDRVEQVDAELRARPPPPAAGRRRSRRAPAACARRRRATAPACPARPARRARTRARAVPACAAYAASDAEVLPVEAQATAARADAQRLRHADGHAAVLERAGRVVALVLEQQRPCRPSAVRGPLGAAAACCPRGATPRRRRRRQHELAEPPHARRARPARPRRCGRSARCSCRASRPGGACCDLEQPAARGAARRGSVSVELVAAVGADAARLAGAVRTSCERLRISTRPAPRRSTAPRGSRTECRAAAYAAAMAPPTRSARGLAAYASANAVGPAAGDRAPSAPASSAAAFASAKPGRSGARAGSAMRSSIARPRSARVAGGERRDDRRHLRRLVQRDVARHRRAAARRARRRCASAGRDARARRTVRRHREADDVERVDRPHQHDAAEQRRRDVVGVPAGDRRFGLEARLEQVASVRAGDPAARWPPPRPPRRRRRCRPARRTAAGPSAPQRECRDRRAGAPQHRRLRPGPRLCRARIAGSRMPGSRTLDAALLEPFRRHLVARRPRPRDRARRAPVPRCRRDPGRTHRVRPHQRGASLRMSFSTPAAVTAGRRPGR